MSSNYVHKSLLKHVAKERDDARKERDAAWKQIESLGRHNADLQVRARELEWYLAQALTVVDQLMVETAVEKEGGFMLWDISQQLIDYVAHIWNPEARVP